MSKLTEAVEKLKVYVEIRNMPEVAMDRDISLVLDELDKLRKALNRSDLITQLRGEYGTDDKAMYKDPRYPHTPEPPK